jgi:hypothetical protein
LFLHPGRESLIVERRQSFLSIGAPARLDLRQSASPKSALVRRIGAK